MKKMVFHFDIRYSIFDILRFSFKTVSCGSLLTIFLLGSEIFLPRSATAAEIEILTPRPGATVAARIPETHMVLRRPVSKGIDQLQVEGDGKKLVPREIRQHQGSDYLHFRLPLKPGMNVFTILPDGQRLEIGYKPLQANVTAGSLGKDVYLFHRSDELPKSCGACHDLHKTALIEPVGLTGHESCAVCHRNIFEKAKKQHSTTKNNLCLTCHQQFVKPWRIGFPLKNIKEMCLACHTGKRDLGNRKFVHGPLNVGGCTLCHNPHGDNNRYHLWADGAAALCVACHSDKEGLMLKEKGGLFVHGIIHGPGCVACHDPHATDHKFMLHKPINELCIGCHQGLAGITRGHPVGGHPLTGPTERRRPGRELSCASCHDPHGTPHRDLLVETFLGGQFCRVCHK